MQIDQTSIIQLTSGAVVALVGLVFGLQKMMKSWKDSVIDSDVTKKLHEELERMSNQNKVLSDELGKLQLEIIKLYQQLRTLSEENQRLHNEVSNLTSEVTRLQNVLKGQ